MCVFCDGFRNRVKGYEELDDKLIEVRDVRVGVEKNHGSIFLIVRYGGAIVSAIPISHCPLCGEKIGGKKNDYIRE